MAASHQPHFLLIPYSEQGHIIPMLSLARQLLRLGCRVTFVKADRHLPTTNSDAASAQSEPLTAKSEPPTAALSMAHDMLRFVTLPVRNELLCVDLKTMTRFEIFKNTLAGLEDRQDLVVAIIEESKASSCPVTCIVCDILLWRWARHVVHAHRIRSAVLSIFSALTFYISSSNGKDDEIEEVLISQFGMPSMKNSMAYSGLSNMKDYLELKMQKKKYFDSLTEGIEEANPILINSFKALEGPLLPLLEASCFDVRFIGPCLLECQKDDVGMGSSMAQQSEIIFIEDTTCLTWLDQQEKGSVLFVSFGSEAEIEERQIEEIELGIEKSGYKFLWVVRPNALARCKSVHSIGKQMHCQEKGMFVSWAPQKRVLQHLAVGGFLTHSGWNSTLESLTFGVPMLCLPTFGDHAQNANFVQFFLQVGIRLSISKDGLVHSEEVTNGVQAIMQGHFSQKVAQVRELAQSAIEESHHDLTSFVRDMD